MKVFVTGATGVIGRRTVPMLVDGGHDVTAIARSQKSAERLLAAGARPAFVDLFDLEALRRAVAGHNAVVNLATHIPSSSLRMMLPGAWRENDRVRGVASSNLVDAAIEGGVQRFIQESFAPVYPDRGDAWILEDTPIATVRFNRAIEDAERAALRFTESGRTGIALRFGAFYGSDAWQTLDLIKLVRKGWAPIPGKPEAFISSVSHDDAATAVVAAMDASAGIYNVVDDEPLSHREYVDALASALDVASPRLPRPWLTLLFGSVGEMMARSVRISNRKLRLETSWTPNYPSVREGWRAVVSELRRAEQFTSQKGASRPGPGGIPVAKHNP